MATTQEPTTNQAEAIILVGCQVVYGQWTTKAGAGANIYDMIDAVDAGYLRRRVEQANGRQIPFFSLTRKGERWLESVRQQAVQWLRSMADRAFPAAGCPNHAALVYAMQHGWLEDSLTPEGSALRYVRVSAKGRALDEITTS